jgi:pimeloyl-ACP methyl ester carboxylesterase
MRLLAAAVLLVQAVIASPARTADTIEAHYGAAGPWAVATADVPGYRLSYPADLGAACPVLFLSGAKDVLISPNSAIQTYYGEVPGAAAKALLKGAGHNTIQGTGGGFLGYLTAWLMYQLQDDAYARGAFAGATPEINTNAGWQNQVEKNLP